MLTVENNRCGGNDRRRGFHAVEWNGTSECAEVELSGDRDCIVYVVCKKNELKGWKED